MIGQNIKEQLKKLVELQKIDVDYYDYKKSLKEKPAVIEQLKNQFESKKANLKALEEKLKALQVDLKSKDIDLKSKEDQIVKSDSQLATLKSNKDYQAKLHEIESLKADKSQIEEKILVSYDAIDEVRAKIDAEKVVVGEEEKQFNAQKKVIEDEIKVMEDRLKVLDSQRKQITPGIQPDILARYDRILQNKEGLAISSVKNHACGGCYMNVTEQMLNEIRMYDRLIFCEMCARFLYIEEEL